MGILAGAAYLAIARAATRLRARLRDCPAGRHAPRRADGQTERPFDMITTNDALPLLHSHRAQLPTGGWKTATSAVEESVKSVDEDRLGVDAEDTSEPLHIAATPNLQPQHLVVWG